MNTELLEHVLDNHKIVQTSYLDEPEWTPLREAWRGDDHTLGNRIQERQVHVQGRAVAGHSNAAIVLKELQDEGFNVLGYVETAQAATDVDLTGGDIVKDPMHADFHGLLFGIIDVVVQITIVEFRETPCPS